MTTPFLDRSILDLGRDADRMTAADADRQHATVNRLLAAFFGPTSERREVQLLADEVGLGKTFVALAVAYVTLAALRERNPPPFIEEISKAYRAVVVVTPPGNHALAQKWTDEVGAMVKRSGLKPEDLRWFGSARCYTPEDLLIALRKASDFRRKPGSVPTVLICEVGIFTKKIQEKGAKLRFLAATIFQWLGQALRHEVRRHVIRRAAEVRGYEDWAENVRRGENVELWDFAAHEQYLSLHADDPRRDEFGDRRAFEAVPFRYDEICNALAEFARTQEGREALYSELLFRGTDEPQGIVPYCKWIAGKAGKAEPYFDGFITRVSALYRSLFPSLMARSLPLVIADEAHHWRRDTEGCRSFKKYLAPFTHRLLMLTATPFQLHRDELAGMFAVADFMASTIGVTRVEELQRRRKAVLSAMETSEDAGKAFSRLWGRLGDDLRATLSGSPLPDQPAAEESEQLTRLIAGYWHELDSKSGSMEQRLQALPGRLRPFFAAVFGLKRANARLSELMRELVIRHRRGTTHRRYRIGREYPPKHGDLLRPDQHQLHAARGSTLPTEAELSQFLLMKVVASATRGRRKTALGMDVTGAYSTLWNSREGKKAVMAAAQNEAAAYFPILRRLTGGRAVPNSMDSKHPKVRLAISAALDLWDHDEKTLIFCFRLPTAIVLRDLISREIEKRIRRARRALLQDNRAANDSAALAQFKRSLTARTGSVLPAFMDRVLLGWAQCKNWPLLQPDLDDLRSIARLAARAYVKGNPAIRDLQKPDRVLLARICEHILAQKYQQILGGVDSISSQLLARMADVNWIESRYALDALQISGAEESANEATDVLTRSSLSATYEIRDQVDDAVFQVLLRTFARAHERGGGGLIGTVVSGPNLFVPLGPFQLDHVSTSRARKMTEQLWKITLQGAGMQWEQRSEVVDAVNRAFLRDHFLLRLPREVFKGDDENWSEALVRGFHSPQLFGEGGEPVAAKMADFLDELAQMTTDERAHSLRYALNSQGRAVVLVSGSTRERDAVFRGFNSPLLPEILICTQVGQEGIDLHRHCNHVVHYDLGWNPATIEQRTGRIDRIGSKTQRERKLSNLGASTPNESSLPGLEVALPYLAATYDERMFDRLYTRAQAFDLLTGGDPSADADDESDFEIEGVEESGSKVRLVALPEELRQAIRVDLRAIHP
jgi:hypothetical protein